MSAKILTLPLPQPASRHPVLPRWRLQLRTWWLGHRGGSVMRAVPGQTGAAAVQAPSPIPEQPLEAQLLELNLMLERARVAGMARRAE